MAKGFDVFSPSLPKTVTESGIQGPVWNLFLDTRNSNLEAW